MAAAPANAAASAYRAERDSIDALRFRMARDSRARLIEEERIARRRRIRPNTIVNPVPKGIQDERDDRRALAALGQI